MAVRIVRQPKKIALIGAPTSAGAHAPGLERAPAALRAAGLAERLGALGFEVSDLGDCSPQLFQPDEENPRARNVGPITAALNDLRPRVEQAVKSGALPLVLGGDCTIALATLAGVRRYFHNVSLVYFDRDADLNVPATSPSGRFGGMVVAHIIGRGAPELVRFWGEPPLVREPDVALFGLVRLDPPEEEFLARSPIRRYTAAEIEQQGPAAVAEAALGYIHTGRHQFVLHLDVDVIAGEEFSACNLPGSGGLRLDAVRQALAVFARQQHLAALEITEYNPERDAEGAAARLLVDLLTDALQGRIPAPAEPAESATAAAAASVQSAEAGRDTAAGPPGDSTQDLAAALPSDHPAHGESEGETANSSVSSPDSETPST